MNHRVYNAVMDRAAGSCEACGLSFHDEGPQRATLDHFFSRRNSETPETCWGICQRCHEEKTASNPSASHWFARYAIFAKRHGYDDAHDWALGEILWRTAKKRTA